MFYLLTYRPIVSIHDLKLWNSNPEEFKSINKVNNIFKKYLKKYNILNNVVI